MRLLFEGLLPGYEIRDRLALPPRCLIWIDALEYLSSDHHYFKLGLNGAWLPLAVAIGSIATSSRLPIEPWDEPQQPASDRYQSAWLDRIAGFIASLIPAAGLPVDVQNWLRDRCWLHERELLRGSPGWA